MGKQPRRGGRGKFTSPDDEGEDGDEKTRQTPASRGLGNQSSTAGMMPPSDSSEEDSEEEVVPKQNAKAGMMPPSDSEEEQEEEPRAKGKAPKAPELTRKEREQLEAQKAPELDPEQIAADMEKLALVRKRRAEQAAKRIAADGWDRYAPLSESNHPPGTAWPPAS
ncbi:hypothetical protein AB1Y20_009914 [Prymnesium parvum]|uniref:Uncharacterized protein n=1 Tax=Prymnesium parvum TaxID=97485 RepID=A0AB34K277_PRYPA|mmetsp:Transcript_35011/g.85103  ORF Transcript_35011/g.85103 Transcript_35011/m.85103 type:complete len:166 (+) Transcript_35011:3-500(+)